MKKAAREPLKFSYWFLERWCSVGAGGLQASAGFLESLLCLELVWTVGLVFKAIPELLC